VKSSKSKRQVPTGDVCREYYESQIFRPTGYEDASPAYFFADASIHLEVFDASLKGTDFGDFFREIMAANIELFGLAWLNYIYNLNREFPPESVSLLSEEIAFTRSYLQDTGRGHLWEKMGLYNDALVSALAEDVVLGGWGRLRDIPKLIRDEDYEKFKKDSVLESVQWWDELLGKYVADLELRNRLTIRCMAVPCSASKITALSQKISLIMAERLKYNLNQAGLFALQRIVVGLYDNAISYLDTVREWGSYQAAKDAREDTIVLMKDWLAHQKQQKK
jgi:hypothetical protein